MEIKLNKTYNIHLSPKEISEFQRQLNAFGTKMLNACITAVNEAAELGLEDNYESAEKIPTESTYNSVKGGIRTTDEIDTYREYGTGIVGSENPHPDAMSGWIYDVNEHGEKGWIYPTSDGYKWTKGIPANKKFYEAMERMQEALPLIISDELTR